MRKALNAQAHQLILLIFNLVFLMDDQANYQAFVDGIFGKDVVSIEQTVETNYVIGALNKPGEYEVFKENFHNRLCMLRDKFRDSKSYPHLLNKVKEVAYSKNWDGAYAELVAYSVLSCSKCPVDILLEQSLPVTESYAKELGGHETNEDGLIKDLGIFFDVKRLGDTTRELIYKIIQMVLDAKSFSKKCHINPEFQIDDDDEAYQKYFNDLREELDTKLTEGVEQIKSSVINGLRYNVVWGAGVSSAISTYDSYRHAYNWRNLIFERYTKKILKHNKFFLVLVNFPWYNNLITDFSRSNEVLYRALARRTFCGYMHSDQKMNTLLKKFNGDDTVFDVSRHISGLIFIEDHSILRNSYSCYTYLNPNAYNPVGCGEDYLQFIVNQSEKNTGMFDTLRYDNY